MRNTLRAPVLASVGCADLIAEIRAAEAAEHDLADLECADDRIVLEPTHEKAGQIGPTCTSK